MRLYTTYDKTVDLHESARADEAKGDFQKAVWDCSKLQPRNADRPN